MPVARVHRSDIAVCGGDVSLPRSIQKEAEDEETRLTWCLKDEVMRRGRVYYAKLAGYQWAEFKQLLQRFRLPLPRVRVHLFYQSPNDCLGSRVR